MASTDGLVMIRVEHLDPVLIQRNGQYGYITGERAEAVRKARLGESKGKWKVLSGIDSSGYENRELTAGGSGGYLTRDAFTLTREDVFGPKDPEK